MQILFNIIVGIAGALGSWILNAMWTAIKDLQKTDNCIVNEVSDIKVLIAGQYMTRPEMTMICKEMNEKLDKIYDKLDGKADK
jgi:hypothetical protein